jgi:hypothetical protein
MKKILSTVVFMLVLFTISAQNVGINNNSIAPHASALVDISSSTKGLLLPRNTTTGIAAIVNPAKGLLVLDTTINQLMVNVGTPSFPNWQTIVFNSGWSLTGNNGTNPATHFVGTTDNQPLRFRVNNMPAGLIGTAEYGENQFLGMYAGGNNTSGTANTAYGSEALRFNTIGSTNIAIGSGALRSNISGLNNTAVGANSLNTNSIGESNTAVGSYTLRNNTSHSNTALGALSLFSNTTGTRNTAVGETSLYTNISGYDNTAVGVSALSNNTSYFNTALGSGSLNKNTIGHDNSAAGYFAMQENTLGSFNATFGAFALGKNVYGNFNTAIGYKALENSKGDYNTAVGAGALAININGTRNTVIGYNANNDLADASSNTIIGYGAHINASINSVAVGYNAYTNVSNLALLGNAGTTQVGGYANWSNFSDGRFKKEVKENVVGLDFVMKLRPVTYFMDVKGLNSFWGTSPYGADEKHMQAKEKNDIDAAIVKKESIRMTGFVAQEVAKVAKEVGYDFDGVIPPAHDKDHYRIAYAEFVVPLVKAVQNNRF